MCAARHLALIEEALEESSRVKRALREQAPTILRAAECMVDAFRAGNRLYACGNGGSACDAMHLAEELVSRYKLDRLGVPAHHLLDASTLTCWSNDYDFASVFERQVQAYIRPGHVLVAISTSGNSPNAVQAARQRGAAVIGLTGRDGGELRALCADLLIAPADATERIQEAHITVIHLWRELMERSLFSAGA